MTSNSTPVRLSKLEMRALFNEHILGKLQIGEFKEEVAIERHANPLKSGQVLCTYSQMVLVKDGNDVEVAYGHRYKLPSAEIGASKLLDPVKIEWEGKVYKLKRETDKS